MSVEVAETDPELSRFARSDIVTVTMDSHSDQWEGQLIEEIRARLQALQEAISQTQVRL